MLIKKYLVNNMNEALTRIRHELGKEAVIISQRKIRKPGFKGIFSPKIIEVTAAIENSSQGKNEEVKNDSFKDSIENIKRVMEKEINSKEEIKIAQNPTDDNLRKEVMEMKELLNKVIKNTAKEEIADPFNSFIESSDIDIDVIKEYEEEIRSNKTSIESGIREVLDREIEVINEDLNGIIALVGPTGVGKTTTIAKLAGKLALIEKKKVGLITVDTYRIGAVDQLRTYAEIMNIPFKVVITIKEMEAAIKDMNNCDVILVDTTGRSSKNSMQISELRAFINKSMAEKIYLVISSTTKNKDIKTITKGYEELGYNRVIITKLDETYSYGSIFNIQKGANKPICFITTGQNVPDDIKSPKKDELLKLILGEDSIC